MDGTQELRHRAEVLGCRLEQYKGEDKWLIRNLHTDVRIAKCLTTEGVSAWLDRAEKGA